MNHAAYEARVRRLEALAQDRPGAYRAGVIGMALLGYAALFVLLAISVGVVLGFVALLFTGKLWILLKFGFKLLVPMGLLGWVVLRALFVRIPPPEGIPLTREALPELFALIDRARESQGVPEPHRVLLIPDMNAAVAEVPLFGIVPLFRSYLLLGISLLEALTPEELEAVLAHEFGHLSGAHGRLTGWIYRVRRAWSMIAEAIEQGEAGGGALVAGFFNWYVPRFGAWSFVMARSNEYEADRAAAAQTSPRTAADALIRVSLASEAEGRYWQGVSRLPLEHQEVPPDLFAGEAVAVSAAVANPDAQRWLRYAMGRVTDVDDTHPALTDRLAALGEEVRMPPPMEVSAASLLGAQHEPLREAIQREWAEVRAEAWAQEAQRRAAMQARLQEVEAELAQGKLNAERLLERATLTEALRGEEAAGPAWRALLAIEPGSAVACYNVACLELGEDDEAGLGLMERAVAAEPQALLPAASIVIPWLRSQGRHAEADGWLGRARDRAGLLAEDQRERDRVDAQDRFAPPELEPEQRELLIRQLQGTPMLQQAWVVRKLTTHRAEQPLHVLAMLMRTEDPEGADAAIQAAVVVLDEVLEGDWIYCNIQDDKKLMKKLDAVEGSGLPV